jgi:hypothetical protein
MKQQMDLLAQGQRNLQESVDRLAPQKKVPVQAQATETIVDHGSPSGTNPCREDGDVLGSERAADVPRADSKISAHSVSRSTEMAEVDLRDLLAVHKTKKHVERKKLLSSEQLCKSYTCPGLTRFFSTSLLRLSRSISIVS